MRAVLFCCCFHPGSHANPKEVLNRRRGHVSPLGTARTCVSFCPCSCARAWPCDQGNNFFLSRISCIRSFFCWVWHGAPLLLSSPLLPSPLLGLPHSSGGCGRGRADGREPRRRREGWRGSPVGRCSCRGCGRRRRGGRAGAGRRGGRRCTENSELWLGCAPESFFFFCRLFFDSSAVLLAWPSLRGSVGPSPTPTPTPPHS